MYSSEQQTLTNRINPEKKKKKSTLTCERDLLVKQKYFIALANNKTLVRK